MAAHLADRVEREAVHEPRSEALHIFELAHLRHVLRVVLVPLVATEQRAGERGGPRHHGRGGGEGRAAAEAAGARGRALGGHAVGWRGVRGRAALQRLCTHARPRYA